MLGSKYALLLLFKLLSLTHDSCMSCGRVSVTAVSLLLLSYLPNYPIDQANCPVSVLAVRYRHSLSSCIFVSYSNTFDQWGK